MASLMLGQVAHADNEAVWSKSYQLESARQYAESLVVLEEIKPVGLDAELMMLRRGWLNYLLGEYSDSISWYKQAIRRNPKSIDAVLGVTLPLLAQQRWREAALYARQALEMAPNDYTAYLRLIVAEEGIRDWPAMKKHAEILSERYPSDASALVYLARAHAWMGNASEARKTYMNVLSRSPGHLQARAYLLNGALN
jgi:tetratricopeptide (TPR) repeat protein